MSDPEPKTMMRDDVIDVLRHPEKYTPDYVQTVSEAKLLTFGGVGTWLRYRAENSRGGWIVHWDKRIIDKWVALCAARKLETTVIDRLDEVPA